MSKGPGKIERRLLEIFERKPIPHSTSSLCREVYEIETVEKRHRVAVLRSLKSLARKSAPWLWRDVAVFERTDDWWFDARIFGDQGQRRAPAIFRRPPKRH